MDFELEVQFFQNSCLCVRARLRFDISCIFLLEPVLTGGHRTDAHCSGVQFSSYSTNENRNDGMCRK